MVALILLSLVYFSVCQAVTCSLFPVGRPSVELWSGFVVALDELEGLRAAWSLSICFPLSVAVLLVAEFDSMLLSVLGGLHSLAVLGVPIVLHPRTW